MAKARAIPTRCFHAAGELRGFLVLGAGEPDHVDEFCSASGLDGVPLRPFALHGEAMFSSPSSEASTSRSSAAVLCIIGPRCADTILNVLAGLDTASARMVDGQP